jgi:hypothetical protein
VVGYAIVLAAALVGCKGDKFDEVTFTEGEIVGTGTVKFSTKLEGKVHAETSADDGETWIKSPSVDAAAGSIALLGLQVATTHQLKLVSDEDPDRASDPIDAETSPPPDGTSPFALNSWDPGQACLDGGSVMFSTIGQNNKSGLGIINREGKFVWAFANDAADTLIGRARPGRDGTSIWWNVADEARVDDLAVVSHMNLDGSAREDVPTEFGHHDFVELPDGEVAWLSYRFEDLALSELGESDPDPVAADVIMEASGDGSGARVVFDLMDPAQWPHGITVSGPEMQKCPTVPGAGNGFIPGKCEYSHGNSLAYLPEDDAYLVMFRWLDALVKIDRASGDLLWVFGGEHDEFSGNDDDRFVHGHFSDAWQAADGLHVLIVDNHDADSGDEQEDSRYTEFVLDEGAKTFERTWVYQSDKFESLLGDIRRIPVDGCENRLLALSAQGRMIEVTPSGEIVWDVGLPLGNVVARVQFLPDLYDLTGTAYP